MMNTTVITDNVGGTTKRMLACLLLALLAVLAACTSTGSDARHPIYGTVLRVIDATADPAVLEPCLASRVEQIGEGKRFAAIRYRHWASHFMSIVYAEVPAGMTVHARQNVEIEPAQCSRNQLAVILGPAPASQ